MGKQKRIETDEAKERRSKRQHFAVPGGSHDKLVSILGKTLPMGVGVLAALMVITPLSPRGEVSFLLDRNKVAVIDERLRVDNALYRGQDDRGRPFSLTAGEAVQRSSQEGLVRMKDLVARILLPEGPSKLAADTGQYDIDAETVDVDSEVRLTAADGYSMMARGVAVDLKARRMVGSGGIAGTIPAGTFSANRLEADLANRTLALDGNAKLRMTPGALRIP
ncbi:LPS export ABC transporter periplasmic protein LptC [Altererythrobacter sp. RZ02]|uniref:LPS export ABC transporter periplasmic protein LptC n=1 Tax=Pontixanthobacter rizhaonensis TaxID=2730337 RepID=A0A848QIJ4_9SPHN|nr:LPS export ABC transporter periplasmic protein LptC [Pontixanthobacter rizhaonensis]NMW32472.1 LPS export ABC transporter periplasmic protein LptC [Pontixanthobacter rizhaonensis]